MPTTKGLKKDSDRAITPAVEAVHVPAHLELPGSTQAKQPCHLHAQPSLGQSCHRQKKSCVYACRVASVVSNSLPPCGLWPARLLCQESGNKTTIETQGQCGKEDDPKPSHQPYKLQIKSTQSTRQTLWLWNK